MKLQKGFTLVELLVAVVMVSILMALAIPSYNVYVQRAARATVQADLMMATSAMERIKGQNFSYRGAAVGTTFPNKSPSDAAPGDQKYDLQLICYASDGMTVVVCAAAAVSRYAILAVSTPKLGVNEVLKINEAGGRCYLKNATDCIIGTDPSWQK